MAEPKTKANDMPVADFIDAIQDTQVRQDCWTIVGIMQAAAQASPRMWGTAIIGFGQYRAVNASGKGNDWMLIGFSPRKQAITLYLMLGGVENAEDLLARLGKYTARQRLPLYQTPVGCRFSDPQELVGATVAYMVKTYPSAGSQASS